MRIQWVAATDDHGGSDADDILAGIEELIAMGVADPDRLFLFGHSAGAWLAAHLISIGRRFAAAVTWEGIYDLRLAYFTRAANQAFADLIGGTPWEKPEQWKRGSPLTRAANVCTPTLVLAGEAGSLQQATAWWQALRDHGVPGDYFIYRDEGHVNARPANRADVLQRSINWFRRHERASSIRGA
jgi:dipeptidyl aminopeptidase/acylaminoacyl peptidase